MELKLTSLVLIYMRFDVIYFERYKSTMIMFDLLRLSVNGIEIALIKIYKRFNIV